MPQDKLETILNKLNAARTMLIPRAHFRLVPYLCRLRICCNLPSNVAFGRRHLSVLNSNSGIEGKRLRRFCSLPSSSDENVDAIKKTTPACDNSSRSASSEFDPNKSYDQARTIIVNDLSQSSTEEMLKAHFLLFGKVTRCTIKVKMPSTKLGVVEFATVREAEKALEHFPHIIDGREVFLVNKSAASLVRDYRLSLEGLSDETSTKDLRHYFSQFGDIFACHVMRDEHNRSLGRGFVMFRSQEAINNVLNSPSPHLVGNDKITVKHILRSKDKAVSKTRFVNESTYSHMFDSRRQYNSSRKVTVGDLSNVTTKESLYEHFSDFGTVTGCKYVYNKDGERRNTAMVEFATNADTEKAAQFFPHIIDGREVAVFNERTYELKKKYEISVFRLAETTSSNDLRQYFSKFGEIVTCYIPMDEDNMSRKFGFVAFNSQEAVKHVLDSAPHYIGDRMITVEQTLDNWRTVFVAALSKYTTEDTLFNYFRNFGDVTSCQLVKDKDSGQSRRIADVSFATIKQAQNALNCVSHIIDGHKVVVIGGGTNRYKKYEFFVGGLSKTTSDETFHQYFSQFGKVIGSHIVLNEGNSSRGFGYVMFMSQGSVDRVLNSVPHYINGQPVTLDLISKSGKGGPREFTLHLSNLDPRITVEALRSFYSKYGQLTNCVVKVDRKSEESRQFGYVAFSSLEEVERSLNDQPHFIEGIRVVPSRVKDMLELFIRYLSPKTTETSLETFFSRYGHVRKIRIIRDEIDTRAVVSFHTKEDILKAANDRPHFIDNKLVLSFQKDCDYTLFVDGLPRDATEEALRDAFSQFGKIVHWQIRQDRLTGKPIGYGYVTFSTAEEAASAVKSPPAMEGTTLKVMLAIKDNLESRLFRNNFQ